MRRVPPHIRRAMLPAQAPAGNHDPWETEAFTTPTASGADVLAGGAGPARGDLRASRAAAPGSAARLAASTPVERAWRAAVAAGDCGAVVPDTGGRCRQPL